MLHTRGQKQKQHVQAEAGTPKSINVYLRAPRCSPGPSFRRRCCARGAARGHRRNGPHPTNCAAERQYVKVWVQGQGCTRLHHKAHEMQPHRRVEAPAEQRIGS